MSLLFIFQLQEPGILPSRSKLIYVLFQIPFGLTLPTDKFRMASRLVSRWISLHQRFRGIVKQWVILLRYDRFLNKTIILTLQKKFKICWLVNRWFPTLEIVMFVFYFDYKYAVDSLSFGVISFHIAMIGHLRLKDDSYLVPECILMFSIFSFRFVVAFSSYLSAEVVYHSC